MSKIRLKSGNGGELSLDANSLLTTSKNVTYLDTVEQATNYVGTNGDVIHISDIDRGGVFIYDDTATDNGGTVFGKCVRQYEGAVNVKWFGAKDGQDSTDAFQKVLAESFNIFIPSGTYLLNKTLNLGINGGTKKRTIKGEGINSTKLYWNDYSNKILYGVNCTFNFSGLEISDITFKGNGVSELSNGSQVTGLYDSANDSSYNIEFNRVEFSDWSGNGLQVNKWFDATFNACSARNINNYGYIIDGGQTLFWHQEGGRWHKNIGYADGTNSGFILYVKKGYTEITGFNTSTVHNGIRIGAGTSEKKAKAKIKGANLEWIQKDGIGIKICDYSSLVECVGVTQYGPDGEGNLDTALSGIQFDNLYGFNKISDFYSVYYESNKNSGTQYPIRVLSNANSSSVLEIQDTIDTKIPMGDGLGGTVLTDKYSGSISQIQKVKANT